MASSFSLFECGMTIQNLSPEHGKIPIEIDFQSHRDEFLPKDLLISRRGIEGGVLKAHVVEKDSTFARTKSHVYRVRWMFKGSSNAFKV